MSAQTQPAFSHPMRARQCVFRAQRLRSRRGPAEWSSIWVVLALVVVLPWTCLGQCPASPYNSETRIFKAIQPKAGNTVLANPLKNGSPNADLKVVV